MDRTTLDELLQRGLSVEAIARRFGKHPSTVSYWMKKHGLEAVGRERRLARGGLERARLDELVEAGLTISEISARVDRSKSTVRHWLRRYGLRTKAARRIAEQRGARKAGLNSLMLTCRRHGETTFVIDGSGAYRCGRCRAEAVSRRRRKLKQLLVDQSGGRCAICGYDRYIGALEFHHLVRQAKRLSLSNNGVTLSLEALLAEARKCVLLCSNCHAEVEGGAISLPVD